MLNQFPSDGLTDTCVRPPNRSVPGTKFKVRNMSRPVRRACTPPSVFPLAQNLEKISREMNQELVFLALMPSLPSTAETARFGSDQRVLYSQGTNLFLGLFSVFFSLVDEKVQLNNDLGRDLLTSASSGSS